MSSTFSSPSSSIVWRDYNFDQPFCDLQEVKDIVMFCYMPSQWTINMHLELRNELKSQLFKVTVLDIVNLL